MSAMLEQSPEELDYLIGAKLIDVKKVREEYKFGEFTDVHEAIRLVFALPKRSGSSATCATGSTSRCWRTRRETARASWR